MGSAAGGSNDDAQAALGRGGGVLVGCVGGAVGGNHADFVGDAELIQQLGARPHSVEVRVAAHDDADAGSEIVVLAHRTALHCRPPRV